MPTPSLSVLLICLFCLLAPPVAISAENTIPTRWTVQQAVRFALEHSPDARAAQARMQVADADLQAAWAAFYPQLGVSAEYNRTNNPMYSFGNILNQGLFTSDIDFNDPGTTDTLQAKAMVQYRLYNGGQDRASLAMAKEQGQAARFDQEAIHAQLGFAVVRAFHTVRQAEETVRARQAAREAMAASLAVARARFQEGSLLKEDLLNLEVQEARTEEQHIQARHELDLAQRGFLNLLGLGGGEVRLDAAGSAAQEAPVAQDGGTRPELTAMAATIRALEAQARRTEAGRYPSADAFGSYQTEEGLEMDEGSGNSWMAGIRLNYSLFDGYRTEAATARARAQLAAAREEQRKLQLALDHEAEQARLALAQEEERLKVTARMVDSATESARLARLRFKEGVLLASDLITTENRLTDALMSHALAAAARSIAVADLRRAVGLAQFKEGN